MPHSNAVAGDEDQSGYSWVKSNDGSKSMTRNFTNLEHMFIILNQKLYGQNCPFMGASISLRGREYSSKATPFNISQLHARGVKAFCQTRWKYPTVAARIIDGQQASYPVESRNSVDEWADRTVFTICQDGGWLALRERLSRESCLPTPDGDCCLFYIIVPPEETVKPELQSFDVLMRVHHALIDGSGIRAVLDEFLQRLADPLPDEEVVWGEEIRKLLPAAILLSKAEEPESDSMNVKREEGIRPFDKPDVGIPVYRPDIPGPKAEHQGTLLVSHTFEDAKFLSQLKAAGRRHGVKLTGVLHAAMLKAVYDISIVKPDSQDMYYSGSPMDLRNGHLLPEYCERSKYVNLAVAIQSIKVPCNLFEVDQGSGDQFWEAAACISNQWEAIKLRKDLTAKADSDAKALTESLARNKKYSNHSNTKPRTCPSFASDPPGSPGLHGFYPVPGHRGLELVLTSYQMSSDQMRTVVSARSHSWIGILTLCLMFNAIRNPKDKMQRFLDKWSEIVAEVERVDNAPNLNTKLENSSLEISQT